MTGLTNKTPRMGARRKKLEKNSDSESEEPPSSEKAPGIKASATFSSNSADLNSRVIGRLIAFGVILLVTFVTRFYGLEEPSHIW